MSWHAVPENKKPSGVEEGFLNANWVVPVLAVFMWRPQSELKSARLMSFQRVGDNTERAGKSQLNRAALRSAVAL
ncbi:hypothetical protein [Dechloromonas denitrificans]|uniref:hypothetical protein n=1 Tax=Dechloromonas denitrificans TaxID=281362 RepID=UPI0012F7DA29|nr:hypothetical protein [Dechloromonas denitrificans]